ncbi:MAG: hypothetical protein IKU48_02995 [Clostridia bacterium]|nr:hypothetical protein [Clostridia bacterium]
MKKQNLFRIGLQFFAENDVSSDTNVDMGAASPVTAEQNNGQASVAEFSDNQLESEFEQLIKGGKYENAFKKRTQSIIDKRFKGYKALEESVAKQQPLIDFLSAKYGIDSADTSALLQKMQNDSKTEDSPKENNADTQDLKIREYFLSQKAKALSKRWSDEGEQLRKIFPSFNFKNELKNPVFSSLLKSGMPLSKAYTAAHSDEILKSAVSSTAKKVAEQTLKSIRANGSRVAENGLRSSAGTVRKTDVSSLTGKEIRSIIKQVENGSKIRL